MVVDKHHADYALYLVTDRMILGSRSFLVCLEEALQGGVTLVQLREKSLASREFYQTALQVKNLCHRYDTPCIINDRIDIMLAADLDGVHIGQQDLPIDVARGLIGPDKILGYSVSNLKEAWQGEPYADYLGAGPVYTTDSKADAGTPIGIHGLQAIRAAAAIPVVAIGGINNVNIEAVKRTGVDGVAVISALWGKADIAGACLEMRRRWEQTV